MQTDTIHVMLQQVITYWTSMRSFSPDETQQNTLCLLCFLAPMTAYSFFIHQGLYTRHIYTFDTLANECCTQFWCNMPFML